MIVKNAFRQNLLRTLAITSLLISSIGSLFFVIYAGRNNSSFFLPALFIIWVLSPFIGLIVANRISKRWTEKIQLRFYWFMIVLTAFSLIAYTGVLTPHNAKPAFIFLIIPFLSWFLMLTIYALLIIHNRRHHN